KVVYEEDFHVKCPECHKMIQVGWAGPPGITQHQGKKRCQATKKAKAAEALTGRQPTLFSLGFSRENHQSSQWNGTTVASSGVQGDQSETWQAMIISTTVNPNKKQPLSWSSNPDVAQLLTKLHNAAERLPGAYYDALRPGDMNKLTDFIGHPTHLVSLDMPIDDVWELADPILNRALGFEQSQAELWMLIQQNRVGTVGLCNFMEYLLIEKHMESKQDVGGGTATTVQAPPAHATERNWEFDIPFNEIEAPLGESLLETTSTAALSLLAGNQDAFIWDAVPTQTGRLRGYMPASVALS
ncbi:hypothetical protein AX15_001240, partial [Amanita polypyramis BW_CC]